MIGTFEIKTTSNDRFVFNLKAGNGEVVLTSNIFPTKEEAAAVIASVKSNAPFDGQYERKVGSNDKPYFVLKATDGQVLGRSEMYSSHSSMENGIKSVMRNAATATIKDLTEVEEPAHK